MRKVSRAAALATLLAAPAPALAEGFTLNQNQTGFNLPGVSVPGGFDEVRAADGTVCRSAIANAGPYVDVGAVGNQQDGSFQNGAVYGRVIVPLGRRGGRPDCRRLYELELQRLKMEVRLMRAGLGGQVDEGGPPGDYAARGPDGVEAAGAPGGLVAEGVPVPRTRALSARRVRTGGGDADWTEAEFTDG